MADRASKRLFAGALLVSFIVIALLISPMSIASAYDTHKHALYFCSNSVYSYVLYGYIEPVRNLQLFISYGSQYRPLSNGSFTDFKVEESGNLLVMSTTGGLYSLSTSPTGDFSLSLVRDSTVICDALEGRQPWSFDKRGNCYLIEVQDAIILVNDESITTIPLNRPQILDAYCVEETGLEYRSFHPTFFEDEILLFTNTSILKLDSSKTWVLALELSATMELSPFVFGDSSDNLQFQARDEYSLFDTRPCLLKGTILMPGKVSRFGLAFDVVIAVDFFENKCEASTFDLAGMGLIGINENRGTVTLAFVDISRMFQSKLRCLEISYRAEGLGILKAVVREDESE